MTAPSSLPLPGEQVPLPVLNLDNGPFYEFAKKGELRFQKCSACGAFRHYPRPICPKCMSMEYTWERSTGRGTVYTFTIAHGPTLPCFSHKVPYNVVLVQMEEGVFVVSEVLDCPPEAVKAGMPVEATFQALTDEITLVKFRRA